METAELRAESVRVKMERKGRMLDTDERQHDCRLPANSN